MPPRSKTKSLLDDLEPLTPYENIKPVAYKTVDTFAGIVQDKLWLKHEEDCIARTDGHCITVDLNEEDMYLKVEHELSHILFKSDSTSKVHFTKTYSEKIVEFAKSQGTALDKTLVIDMVDFILNLIEDHRVDSLWGMLYPGSQQLQKELHYQTTSEYASQAHNSYLLYFACIEGGADIPPGPMDVYRPLFEAALKQVERKGFLASLLISKWLVTNLVKEILKHAQWASDSGVKIVKKEDAVPGDGKEEEQGSEGLEQPVSDTSGDNDQSSPQKRATAMDELSKHSEVPEEIREEKNDVKTTEYEKRGARSKAQQDTNTVLRANIDDQQQMSQLLGACEKEMRQILEKAQEAIRASVPPDEWVRRDSMAKVVFKDVRPGDADSKAHPLAEEDQETVRRLKAFFYKQMGRRRSCLDDSGLEVDVPSYIERRVSKMPVPCFRQEERGRGFKALILMDRSSSMLGGKTEQTERVCRIIGKALKFPFVTMNVWGFQSLEQGEVDVTRFDPTMEVFQTSKSKVGGNTPLHTAIRLAVRYLEEGSECKQLMVITDGEPCYSRKGGLRVPTSQLQKWVREEVRRARQHGINVTCLMIGTWTKPAKLKFMFGPSSNWKIINEDKLGTDLLNLVTSSFAYYLRNR